MAKAKAKTKADTTKNGKHGEVVELERVINMETYLTSAKDLLECHDDEIDAIHDSLKELHAKIDRALSRLGIS